MSSNSPNTIPSISNSNKSEPTICHCCGLIHPGASSGHCTAALLVRTTEQRLRIRDLENVLSEIVAHPDFDHERLFLQAQKLLMVED